MRLKMFVCFLVSVAVSCLTFLVGNEAGSYVAGACTGGVLGGVSTVLGYHLGAMCEKIDEWQGKVALWMAVAAVAGGLIGGLMFLAKG